MQSPKKRNLTVLGLPCLVSEDGMLKICERGGFEITDEEAIAIASYMVEEGFITGEEVDIEIVPSV